MFNEVKYYLYKYYKYLIILIIIVIVFLFIPKKNEQEPNDLIIKNDLIIEEQIETETTEDTIKTIKIDIKGAVKNPGVYELDDNSRVNDAIKLSGGLNNNADTTILNLSKTLKDQDVIIIYTKDEINEMKKGSTTVKIVEKECICPQIENVACIENSITNAPNENKNESTNNNDSLDSTNQKISLNTASQKQLETLPGIGSSKAQAIIKYREENNGFKTIEDLKKVSGIGDSTFEKIKDFITI